MNDNGMTVNEQHMLKALIFAQKYLEDRIMKTEVYTGDDWYNNVVLTIERVSGKNINEVMK